MKAIPFLLIIALVTVGIYAGIRNAVRSDPQPAAIMAVVETATAAPSSTATPNYTPTPDFLALAQGTRAALDVDLARARNTAEVAGITATAIVASARSTEQRINDLQATSQALGLATQTQAAQAAQIRAAIALATEADHRTATAQAPITRRAEIVADWEPAKQLAILISIVCLNILIGMLGIQLAKVYYSRMVAERDYYRSLMASEPVREVAPIKDLGPVMVQETQVNGGFVQATQFELPAFLTRDKLQAVAEAILGSGVSFSRAAMVDSGPLTDGEWDSLRWWMSRRRYAQPLRPGQDNSPWFVTGEGHNFLSAFR